MKDQDVEIAATELMNRIHNDAVEVCLENVRKIWVQDGTDQEKVLAEVESQITNCYVGEDNEQR